VGIGWNGVECRSIGHSFDDRGRRLPEQVEVLRRLWEEPVVEYAGSRHQLHGVGIKPYPVQRPIPVWFGATSEVAIRRAARLADGFICFAEPGPRLEQTAELFWGAVDGAGRSQHDVGLEGKIDYGDGDLDRLAAGAVQWRDAGATHLCVNTMKAGLDSVDEHIEAVRRVFEAIGHAA
jgi:alkanesulfonate monooxygenase SsuD/methylene tetrahydromethanopterin reductase-like flavin-dependent oxidoreductase (luciferase family)